MEAERMSQQKQPEQESQPAEKKVKITFDEYQRLSKLIVGYLNQLEKTGQESVQQSEIVNKVIQTLVMDNATGTSMERAAEMTKKITNTINHLITKEGVIMITQDSKIKNERLLCLNINVDMGSLDVGNK